MIAIPEMQMPEGCRQCPLMDVEWLTCNAPGPAHDIDVWPYKYSRHPKCPLVDPEYHDKEE